MNWHSLTKTSPELEELMETHISKYVKNARWYGGKASLDKAFYVDHLLPIDYLHHRFYLMIVEIMYAEGFVHNYLLPIGIVEADYETEGGVISELEDGKKLVDAVYLASFRESLFKLLRHEKKVFITNGFLQIARGRILKNYDDTGFITSKVLAVEQSNTTMVFNDQFFLKLYRRLSRDPNPDIEMAHYLSEESQFKNIPAFAASLNWCRPNLYDVSIGLMQEKIENQGDAWTWTNNELSKAFDRVVEHEVLAEHLPTVALFKTRSLDGIPVQIKNLLGETLLTAVKTMATRTAEMHIKSSGDKFNKLFTKDNYNGDYAVWLKNRIIYQFEARYALLDKNFDELQGLAKDYAQYFMENKAQIKNRIYAFDESELSGQRIRIHGDYHLGQILASGKDFYILDFEGEPEATVHDRKVKQTPLKDVAGLFRSFHYAIYSTIFGRNLEVLERRKLFAVGEIFYTWIVSIFMHHYLAKITASHLNIGYKDEIEYLLKYHLLEKAIYELGYELNARPTWAIIPLRGIYMIMKNTPL
ncbi:MAG: trehalose synthase [Salibacteraceae bacterium]|nr:trehalose synthase [Salibacteraceae bacterium]